MRLRQICSGIFMLIAVAGSATAQQPKAAIPWTMPEVSALPRDAKGQLIRDGRDLVLATYAHVGPKVADEAKRFAGNNLACTNCHLDAGTKKFGLPLFGIFGDFPGYSARTGGTISIEDRINGCMTRSMNGRAIPNDAPEMRAFVAYIEFLSTGVPPGQHLPGLGAGRMKELSRAADPQRGRAIYEQTCAACHNTDGSGIMRDPGVPQLGYMMPPLWGPDSYNDGAGMARLTNFANFVHFNMPHGADYLNPQMTVEQSWDVAAYVLSQPRPHRAGVEKDFPDLLSKPVDAPYGPYADRFSEKQHKFGPFGPIRDAIKRLKSDAGRK